MPCTEAYKEHIEYTFNAFCRVVIHYAAINAWSDRDRRRQREISFEYLTEEKFYPFSTTDKYFIDLYKQYPVTICGQRVILTNGELAEALSSLPEKKREIIYLYFFGRYTQFPDKYHLPLCSPFQSKRNWNSAVISCCFMLSSVSALTYPFSRAAKRIRLL